MEEEFLLSKSTYRWAARLFSRLEKVLGVNINMHQEQDNVEQGDIFLFNHFARFETFIPQYLLHKKTGAYCRSIASSEFFKEDDALTNYMIRLGAVPNDWPELLPFMAKEILRGHKVVLFPEGGMVKDRSVVDEKGEFNIYSRTAETRRKHHTGAALLANALESYKFQIKRAEQKNNRKQLEQWREELDLESIEALLTAAHKPTSIIPANITFYPIRVDDNFLPRIAELINRKKLSARATEEIIIESNLVMKDTDMDIRFGAPISPANVWSWKNKALVKFLNKRCNSVDDYFTLAPIKSRLQRNLIHRINRKAMEQLRDHYMQAMYALTTVNLSHLASATIFKLIDNGEVIINEKDFYKIIYLCIKHVQKNPHAFLHQGLCNPGYYEQVIIGESKGILTFLRSALNSELIKKIDSRFIFTEKLLHEHSLDQIRLQNIIAVYANEATPIEGLSQTIEKAIAEEAIISTESWAAYRFDDELISFRDSKAHYSKPHHQTINAQQTAYHSGEPYLLIPEKHRKLGVVLVHGLPSSPAELRQFGERLEQNGYAVIGTRLAGHGTSPWDLKEREWPEWVKSVERSYEILSGYCEQICIVGFSTGSVASLLFAAEKPEKLIGIVSVAVPINFNNKSIVFVPILHGITKLLSMVQSEDSTSPFRENESAHPEINYRHIPLKALYELGLMIDAMKKTLADVVCPALIMHAKDDPVVELSSAEIIEDNIGSDTVSSIVIQSDRHGIILEDIGDSQTHIMSFLTRLSETEQDVNLQISKDKHD